MGQTYLLSELSNKATLKALPTANPDSQQIDILNFSKQRIIQSPRSPRFELSSNSGRINLNTVLFWGE